ncbi:PREDICTED: uncharacterized protein LOC108372153 isoform X2 [Rhagoletis zephyria]|uniref:uncharacterized protein LOC108372153 isoform X2 n=1 Tax=Rhagoletis zephyria TaxID=28612 RepID=UPI0008117115|nr:PREDICTED: uncharacterized protein LOC108372153 isoform X2 [Rhagoletis zephyria]
MEKYLQKSSKNTNGVEGVQDVEMADVQCENSNQAPEVAKSSKRRNLFLAKWKDNYNWVDEKSGGAYCKYCEIKLPNNICHLMRHEKSFRHKKSLDSLKNQPKILTSTQTFQRQNDLVKVAELQIIMFLIQHNLPFALITPLVLLIRHIASDSEICKKLKIGKTKATETVKTAIFHEARKDIIDILQNQTFSMIIDETTDISTSKCLAIVVRYFDKTSLKVRDRFLALIELAKFDACTLVQEIRKLFKSINVPLKNCLGFASDNASVMVGKRKGIAALLREDNPNLFSIGCTCHSIHLCASAAGKVLPAGLEILTRNIYLYFAHSAKRQVEFKEFQEYFSVSRHKILKKSITRWLSMEQVVSRILEQWTPLQHYFLQENFDSSENNDLALKVKEELNDDNKFLLLFLSYVLKLLNNLNLEFQTEATRIHVLLIHVKTIYKTILSNFLDISSNIDVFTIDFNNTDDFKPAKDIYCGPKAELFLKSRNLSDEQTIALKKYCMKYYVVLCKEICKRVNFKDPVLLALQGINPESLAETTAEIASVFPNLITEENIEGIDFEWRLLKNQQIVSKELELENFWSAVFKQKNALNEQLFPKLAILISNILCLPHSSATAERVFSQLFLIKDEKRNCLSTETINCIMACKEILKNCNCYEWKPLKSTLQAYVKQ